MLFILGKIKTPLIKNIYIFISHALFFIVTQENFVHLRFIIKSNLVKNKRSNPPRLSPSAHLTYRIVFVNKKTRSMAGSIKVHALYSPRDTALRSVPKLKQFVAHFAMIF